MSPDPSSRSPFWVLLNATCDKRHIARNDPGLPLKNTTMSVDGNVDFAGEDRFALIIATANPLRPHAQRNP